MYNDSISFSIANYSDYFNKYIYTFENINGSWFDDLSGEIALNPDEVSNISFQVSDLFQGQTDISLVIYPENHHYAKKNLNFTVLSEPTFGDVNNDLVLNVLDVLKIVNFIVGNAELSSYELYISDLNMDGNVNVQDIVELVYLILNL
tara:strand:- start:210 stop:653 length:444 start_codon:yes stop_codon:yes gene_type:complete